MQTYIIYTDYPEQMNKKCQDLDIQVLQVFQYYVAPFIKIKCDRYLFEILTGICGVFIDEIVNLDKEEKKNKRIDGVTS